MTNEWTGQNVGGRGHGVPGGVGKGGGCRPMIRAEYGGGVHTGGGQGETSVTGRSCRKRESL